MSIVAPLIQHSVVSGLTALALLLFATPTVEAASFRLPTDGRNMVGRLQVVLADSRNTLLDIARHYELGYDEITAANPGVSVWLPGEGTRIVLPTEFILPPKPWQGIVVNIPQRRLYYFPRPKGKDPTAVVTYPIGISRDGWSTPVGETRIVAKYKDPSWIVPRSIQVEHRSDGDVDFPDYFPPGPNNPMGMYALETGFSHILIHGSNRPWGVGMRVSHGCIRLYPEHIDDLFKQVPVGTPVRIIDQAVSVGQKGRLLYVSVAKPLEERPSDRAALHSQSLEMLAHIRKRTPIDWDRLWQIVSTRHFVPIPVSADTPNLEQIIASIEPVPYAFEPYGIEANDATLPVVQR